MLESTLIMLGFSHTEADCVRICFNFLVMDMMVPLMYTSGEEVRAKWTCVRRGAWFVLQTLIWTRASQIIVCRWAGVSSAVALPERLVLAVFLLECRIEDLTRSRRERKANECKSEADTAAFCMLSVRPQLISVPRVSQ